MHIIQDVTSLSKLSNSVIRHRIAEEIQRLEQQYAEVYSPSIHGWFAVVETEQEIYAPLHGLSFSCCERIQSQLIEWASKESDHFEVLFTINDNEAIMVYIPENCLPAQTVIAQCLMQHIQVQVIP